MRKAQDAHDQTHALCREDPAHRRPLAQANPGVQHPVPGRARSQAHRLHRGVERPRACAAASTPPVPRRGCRSIREWKEKGVEAEYAVFGNKAVAFFKRVGGKVVAQTSHLGDKPHLEQPARHHQGGD